jgi:hypothetical protein
VDDVTGEELVLPRIERVVALVGGAQGEEAVVKIKALCKARRLWAK